MSLTDAQFLDWLASGARRVVLVEAKYHDGVAEQPAYLSQGGYTSGPTDSPANQPYLDIVTVPQWQAALTDTLTGTAVPTWADLEVLNVDGELDAWSSYSWGGRPLSMWIGDPSWPRADFRLVFTGVSTDVIPKDAVTNAIKIQDKGALFNKPITTQSVGQPTLVSGLTYGISEGAPVTSIDRIEDDGVSVAYTPSASTGQFTLAAAPVGMLSCFYTGGVSTSGQPLPIPLGWCFNVTPSLLNSGLHRYRVSQGAIQAIDAVRVDGNPTGHTDTLTRATFDLTAAPSGVITADLRGDLVGGVFIYTAADLIKHVLLDYAGALSSDLDAASFAAFAAACPQPMGTYIDQRTNVLDVCDTLLKSVNAAMWPDRAGKIHVAQLALPTGTPKLTITADDLDSTRDIRQSLRVLPAKSVTVTYRPNHTTQTTLLSSVGESDAADYRQPWRSLAPLLSPGVAQMWLNATELEFDTCLHNAADALALALILRDINGVLWEIWELPTNLAPLLLNLFDVVGLDIGRYGLTGGKLGVVVGITESLLDNETVLKVWVTR